MMTILTRRHGGHADTSRYVEVKTDDEKLYGF